MDFLKGFTKRMKSVGRYAMLLKNSINKNTWKQYKIETLDEQVNLIFTVFLYVMEASLKEEPCTLDDVEAFLGEINDIYYHREWGYEDYKGLADFIINVVLGNSGEVMYFHGYDYEKKEYADIHVQYLANKVIYLENGMRRTSYYLTEDGYNMLLSTMEMENNLKLTIHEMLFKMHLEKADYGHAVDDIKSIFEQLRMQNQKIQSTMHRIRQNALAYSVEEYEQIVGENIHTIEKTREQFRMHREFIEEKMTSLEEEEIHELELNQKDKESLEHLKTIRKYLNKTLDEHQKIFKEHLDLKTLYDRELENYSNMTLVQRIHFRSELYEPVLMDAVKLENIHEFFKLLLCKNVEKIYHPGKALEYQRKLRKNEEEDESLTLGFEEEEFRKEQEQKRKERFEKYEFCLTALFERMIKYNRISLKNLLEEDYHICMPTIEIFREVMIELLTEECIDINILRKEKREHFQDVPEQFQVNEMVLKIVEDKSWKHVHKIYARRSEISEIIQFEKVLDENGIERNIKCSNIELWYE